MTGEEPAAPPPAGEPPAESSAQPPVSQPPAGPPAPPGGPPPDRARVIVRDDLHRSRLTVFFRLILAIPHFIVLLLFGILALVLAVVSWFAILFTRKSVGYDMQERYLRYWTQVYGYVYLAGNPYPGFGGEGDYPVDAVIPPEELPHNRWKTGFRFVLIVPALLMAAALGVAGSGGSYGNYYSYGLAVSGVLPTAAFFAWFACVIRGRMPRGFRDLAAYCLNYGLQYSAYFLLITDRYPTSDPLYPDYGDREEVPQDHPIRISEDDDLRRSRLTVFFRGLLTLPHLIWLALWGLVVFFTVVANWFVTLFAGRPADALHRFNGAYVRYLTHVFAYLSLVANPFPGFVGAPGTYPVDLQIAPPERQNRWKTGFRLILVFPAAVVSAALGGALFYVALFGWFVGLFTAKMPVGLRNLGVFALRYQAQVNGYIYLLTDRYPFSGPTLEQLPPASAPLPEPA